MKNTKKINLINILTYSLLALCAVHFVFLMLGLFDVVNPECLQRDNFNYIVAFVLLAVLVGLYILFLYVETKKNLVVPTWFKIVLYVGLYVFINIYYYLGLYGYVAGIICAYIFLGLVLNIFALAIFFNSQKSENGYLKPTATYTSFSVFAISVCLGTICEIVVSTFKIALIKASTFASLSMAVVDLCTLILVSLVFALLFAISLTHRKKLINGCLIKTYNK